MIRLTRKTLLKAAAGSLVGAASFLYPGIGAVFGANARPSPNATGRLDPLAGAPAEVRRLEGPDPSYAVGEVISRSSDGVVLSSADGVRAVRIPPGTTVWKEFELGPEAIELHDWVDVKGIPQADGTLVARSGWIFVNIGRRDGIVQGASARGLVVKHKKGTDTFELSAKLEVISSKTGAPLPGGVDALTPGTQIGAVGLRLPKGGFRATRIWTIPAE
jgi:hypothetical protein